MRKILILEDREDEQQIIADIIATIDRQTEVFRCADTKEAYVCALEGEIDLFIVDVILKPEQQEDTSGLRFIESIRGVTRYEFTPVIILTCLEDLKSYSYTNLHCYAFIEKPFSADYLRKTISECLRSPKLPDQDRNLYYRKDGAILAIHRSEIVYAVSIMHSLHIYTSKRDSIPVPYLTVKQFLIDAQSSQFLQVSRNTVVNMQYVGSVDLVRRRITLKGMEKPVEIGGKFLAQMREIFGEHKDVEA